ncbi:hypothetical protein R1sor_006424 [Riccia sorocarpa]|uniref:Uncharacterized protein n=1 Tax=Riccia sorocarpa TaxID=122646 RepID=A0ABD3HMZ8_9MARC
MRHSWFVWFVCERDEDGCRRLYWTPGTEQGRARFCDKLLGLDMKAYRKLCIDPDQFGFDIPSVEVEERVRNVVCGVPGKFADNYDMWLKSPQFERWTKAKEAYPWSFEWGIRTKESVQQTFRKRAGMWDEWFRRQPELRNPGSLSWRYKMCEPITGNMFIRFNHLSQLTSMDRTTQCGHGGSRNCSVVGVRDPEHSKTLGAHDVVFYVAKRMLSVDRWGISGREEAVKEMLAFPISHPAVYMTPSQRSTYDEEMFAKGFPTGASLPHAVHGLRLREALDRMTTVNIANRIDHRRTAAYWATFFQEQLMVDPLVCQRPQEMKPRQKKHPDGPREIGKNKL